MKAMKLKSCFLLIGLLLVCNVYAQELCRADFLPKASAAFDLLTQKYSEERIVKEIRAKNVRWVTNLMSASAVFYKACLIASVITLFKRSVTWICQSRCLGMPFVNGRKMRN